MTQTINDETLTAFVLGELDEAERKAVEDAIASDPEVRQRIAELGGAARLSSEAFAPVADDAPGLTAAQRERVIELARVSEMGATASPVAKKKRAAIKITCDGCGARYAIAAEKVGGKVFKIRCKKCQETIVVRGDAQQDPAPTVAPTPAPQAVGAGSPPPMSAGPSGGDDDAETRVFDYSGYQAGDGAQAAPAIWHIVIQGAQQGPYRMDQLVEFVAVGSIDHETFAWRDGLNDWSPIREIDEISRALSAGAERPASEAVSPVSADAAAPSPFDSPVATGGGLFDQPADTGGGGLFDQPDSRGDGLFDQPAPGGGFLGAAGPGAATPGDVFSSTDAGAVPTDGDLFAGGGELDAGEIFASTDAQPPSPQLSDQQASMTGQRSENSVLFSLSNLAALAGDGAGGGSGGGSGMDMLGAPSLGSSGADGEASGLIDIRSMASSISADSDSGGVDDLISIGGGGFAPTLGAPVLAPAPAEGMSTGLKIGLFGGVAALAAAAVVVFVVVLQPAEPDRSAADAQIAMLTAEIEAMKTTGGSAAQLVAVQKELAQAQEAKAGEETGSETGDAQETAKDTEATPDAKGGKTGKKGGVKAGGSKAGSKAGDSKSGGSKKTNDLMGGTGGSGGTKTKKGGSSELDDLLGGATTAPKKPSKKDKPPEKASGGSSLPKKLSRPQVVAGMNAVAGGVKACGQGAGGSITVSVTIANTGRVKSAKPIGGHAGTPVGNCAARAVRRAKFPKFQDPSLTVKYPFKL